MADILLLDLLSSMPKMEGRDNEFGFWQGSKFMPDFSSVGVFFLFVVRVGFCELSVFFLCFLFPGDLAFRVLFSQFRLVVLC